MGWGSKPTAATKLTGLRHGVLKQPVRKPQGSAPGTPKDQVEVEAPERRTRRTKVEMQAERAAREANGGRLPRNWKAKQGTKDDEVESAEELKRDVRAQAVMRAADRVFEAELANEPKSKGENMQSKWLKYKTSKGFLDSTLVMLLEDYLSARSSHDDFLRFVTKERMPRL